MRDVRVCTYDSLEDEMEEEKRGKRRRGVGATLLVRDKVEQKMYNSQSI